VEHTVSLAVTLRTEHADLGSLERAVDAALAGGGQALWAELVRLLEATLPVPDGCPCGGRFKANGRAPRRLVTLAGEVDLQVAGRSSAAAARNSGGGRDPHRPAAPRPCTAPLHRAPAPPLHRAPAPRPCTSGVHRAPAPRPCTSGVQLRPKLQPAHPSEWVACRF
jgi:hypothetical protein